MKEEISEIIKQVIPAYKLDNHFETEHFLYWVKDEFYYDGQSVNKEEFDCIKKYVCKHGTIPSVKRLGIHNNNGYGVQTMLRYSKTYGSLEMYIYNTDLRANFDNQSERIIVMIKRSRAFKVNEKGFVMIGKNRWLSLKNWNHLQVGGEDWIRKLLIHSMIGKDWVLKLESDAIDIQNKNARKANSLEEAVELECGVKPVKMLRKLFKNENDIITIYKLIDHKKVHELTNFVKRNWEVVSKLLERGHGGGIDLLFYYFLSKDNRCERQILNDYFRMLKDEGKKINLRISSYNTLKRGHNELSREILTRELKKGKGGTRLRINNKFPDIESTNEIDVEMIKTNKRLATESQVLHHCVHTYKKDINKGDCAIYNIMYDGAAYTMQLIEKRKVIAGHAHGSVPVVPKEVEEKTDIIISQLRGKHNCAPPEKIKAALELMCEKNELLSPDEGYVSYKRESKEKKEIEQIGDKILHKIFDSEYEYDLPF